MSLFRPEVFENRRFRLHGDVMLTRATSSWMLIALLLGAVAFAGAWISTGRYARTVQAVGRLVPDGEMTEIVERRAGHRKGAQVDSSSRSNMITGPAAGRIPALQLMAELYVPSRAIGFTHPGQEVRLRYDAFPYQRFGSFVGHVTSISRTALGPNEIDAALPIKEPVYRLNVALADRTVKGFGETAPLQPGMTLTAIIVLERRSFLDFLLEPINAVRDRS